MAIKKVLLARPKVKHLFLGYQTSDTLAALNNTQFLAQLLPGSVFGLYKGYLGQGNGTNYSNCHNVGQSNISKLTALLQPPNHNQAIVNALGINKNETLLVTCESFGASASGDVGLDVTVYQQELQDLQDLEYPCIVASAIGGAKSNDTIKTYWNAIATRKVNDKTWKDNNNTDPLAAYMENIADLPDYNADITKDPEHARWLFNRSVYKRYANNGVEKEFYKRNFDTPTLSNRNDALNVYKKGSWTSFVKDDTLQTEFFVKVCNDADNRKYHDSREFNQDKTPNHKRFFVLQSDFLFLSWMSIINQSHHTGGTKQNNANIDPGDTTYAYPKISRYETTINPDDSADKSMFRRFLKSLDVLVFADTRGWNVTYDKPIQTTSASGNRITWEDVRAHIRYDNDPGVERNMFYLHRFFSKYNDNQDMTHFEGNPDILEFEDAIGQLVPSNNPDNPYSFEQVADQPLPFPYCQADGDKESMYSLWDNLCDQIKYAPADSALRTIIRQKTGIDLTDATTLENATKLGHATNIQLYNAIVRGEGLQNDGNKNQFKIHLYSPMVGNVYKVTTDNDAVTLTQATRMPLNNNPCEWGKWIDVSVFNLEDPNDADQVLDETAQSL